MKIIEKVTRAEAVKTGARRYFTGSPCVNGHVAERLVSNFGCMTCAAEKFKHYYHGNREAQHARIADWRKNNKDEVNAKRRDDRAARRDEYRATRREEYRRNADRERRRAAAYRSENPQKIKESVSRWQQANRHVKAEAQTRRKAAVLRATPAWADAAEILKVYEEAQRRTSQTGIAHEVDHFYPLISNRVCGLHVHQNLRVISASANRSKGNKMEPEE